MPRNSKCRIPLKPRASCFGCFPHFPVVLIVVSVGFSFPFATVRSRARSLVGNRL